MTYGNGEMPTWLSQAYNEVGVLETPGADATKRIIEYHSVTSLKATSDEVPWCASFVSWCLEQVGIVSTKSAAARSYLNWGYLLTEPREGAIVIMGRTNNPLKGHVGFLIGESDEQVCVLGGNQKNQVCELMFPKGLILSYRWPYPPEAK